jgi:hypothetical protein
MTVTLTQPLISKKCNHCLETKPLAEFYKNRANKDGLQKRCKPCQSAATFASKIKAGKELTDYRQHSTQLKRKYGITPDSYADMLTTQDGKCAICLCNQCSTGRRFAVDHDHKTGKIRGLLCAECNTALGKFNDEIERLKSAIRYLEASQPTHT